MAAATLLTGLATACLFAFAVIVTRTGQTDRPRGLWLVYVAAGAVISGSAALVAANG